MRDNSFWPEAFVVPSGKIEGYLLDLSHPKGGPKARFFQSFGWVPEEARRLEAGLIGHAVAQNCTARTITPYGLRFHFDGPIHAPDGRHPRIRTVWQVGYSGDPRATFITAKPLPKA